MKPSIGRMVHFVQRKPAIYGDQLVHLPAIVVAVHSDTCVNLQVFTDGTNSDSYETQGVKWMTSVLQDEAALQVGSWHWPERD
jgi:hypothetical protein